MFLNEFYTQENNQFSFSQQQASRFAKEVAGDFNKIHDVDDKRFCVPGDLLFAVTLAKQGLYPKMTLQFTGMVKDNVALQFNEPAENNIEIINEKPQALLKLQTEGAANHNPELLEKLITDYVKFSGRNFPEILVPIMQSEDFMFSPTRGLIMYKSMEINMTRTDITDISLDYDTTRVEKNGKRATVYFQFNIFDGEELVGTGVKEMVLSGVVPYEKSAVDNIVDMFMQAKKAFQLAS